MIALVPVGVAALLIAVCVAGAICTRRRPVRRRSRPNSTRRAVPNSALTLPIPNDTPRAEQRVADVAADVATHDDVVAGAADRVSELSGFARGARGPTGRLVSVATRSPPSRSGS